MSCQCIIEVALHLIGMGVRPEDLTQHLGFAPTKTWRAGDSIERTLLKRKHDSWLFALPEEKTFDLDRLIRHLLDTLEPYRDRIVSAAAQFNLRTQVSCVVYMDGTTPNGHIERDTIRRIAALGAELDIDLMFRTIP